MAEEEQEATGSGGGGEGRGGRTSERPPTLRLATRDASALACAPACLEPATAKAWAASAQRRHCVARHRCSTCWPSTLPRCGSRANFKWSASSLPASAGTAYGAVASSVRCISSHGSAASAAAAPSSSARRRWSSSSCSFFSASAASSASFASLSLLSSSSALRRSSASSALSASDSACPSCAALSLASSSFSSCGEIAPRARRERMEIEGR